jgi:prepilin-type N-terminal cleavage/methylation domain-containing protein
MVGTLRLRRPYRHAFTLIEMMVVIAIMATVLCAALPSLYGFVHKEGFRKTVSDVVDTCRSARAEAIMQDTTAELVFHPREGTCEASAGGSGHGVWAHSAKFEHCTIEMLAVNLRDFKDEPAVTVHFYPNGRCDEMTLVLRSDKGDYRKITIECTTGLPIVSSKLDF